MFKSAQALARAIYASGMPDSFISQSLFNTATPDAVSVAVDIDQVIGRLGRAAAEETGSRPPSGSSSHEASPAASSEKMSNREVTPLGRRT